MAATTECPRCKTGRITRHCDEKKASCGWLRCTARLCGAVIDPRKRRGYLLEDGKTVFFDSVTGR